MVKIKTKEEIQKEFRDKQRIRSKIVYENQLKREARLKKQKEYELKRELEHKNVILRHQEEMAKRQYEETIKEETSNVDQSI